MQELIIEPGRIERQYWRDLWRFRELFLFLSLRNIVVRYKQTVVGLGWAVIRPVLTIAILTVVFGRVAKLPSGDVPYPLLVFCGMLPWQFFATALTDCGTSLVQNSAMISKIYFPRLVLPASSVITSLIDFAISALLMILVMVYYWATSTYVPASGISIVFLPLFILFAAAASLGTGLWLAALMVPYRDFRFIVPFIVQFGLYISPVGFTSSLVPEKWRLLYSLNPMAGVIDGFRWCILGGEHHLYWPGLLLGIVTVAVLLVTGLWYFRRTERTFADII